MPRSIRPFYAVLAEHRAALDRIVTRRALPRLQRLYEEAHDAVARKLHTRLASHLGGTFTTHQQRILLAQLKQGQIQLAGELAGELSDVTREAQTDAVRGLAKSISRLEKHFTGAEVPVSIDEAWKLRNLVGKRRAALDEMHRRSMARWGSRLFGKVHEATSVAVASGASTEEAIQLIPREAAAEWWQGERIVRTETAWAYNSAHADAISEAAEEVPGIMKRWTEHVDDDSGEPLDDRVAPDSLAMHGQVVAPDDTFEFPIDADGMTPAEIERMRARGPWVAPPNRPNDRASLQPWRSGWGIPAWTFRNGRRVYL